MDDDRRALLALSALPRLEGALPGRCEQGIIFTTCDDAYFHQFGRNFMRSAIVRSGEQSVHLHLYDPSPKSLALLRSIAATASAGRVTFSWESTDLAKDAPRMSLGRYCILVRFVRLWQLLMASNSPILALDADAVIRKPLSTAIAAHCAEDVALFLRPKSRHQWRRVLGAAALAAPTALGRRFTRDCAVVMAHYIKEHTYTSVDQLVIYFVWRWYRRRVTGFRCGELTQTFSDWEYLDDSLIWHAKGKRKRAIFAIEPLEAMVPGQVTTTGSP